MIPLSDFGFRYSNFSLTPPEIISRAFFSLSVTFPRNNIGPSRVCNIHDAEDVVQEASLRAVQFFGGFHGDAGRPWLLAIVRNTCFTWLKKHRGREPAAAFDEDIHSPLTDREDPQRLQLVAEHHELLHKALEEMPLEFREVIVLRELEGLSYKEIADVAGIPVGTVMSRLARGRDRLQQRLTERLKKDS